MDAVAKKSRMYFLTAYVEYLLDQGIRSEEYYLSDASRFLRFLLARASAEDIITFITQSADSPTYEQRLRRTLRKFYRFANAHLGIDHDPCEHLSSPTHFRPN